MMLFQHHTICRPYHQAGNALIGFMPFFACMLTMFLFIADIGQYAFFRLSVDNAAYAASERLVNDLSLSETQLAGIAVNTSPALTQGELLVSSSVSDIQNSPYTHHLPSNTAQGTFTNRSSNAAFQTARVSVQFSYRATTPVSRILAQDNDRVVLISSYEQVASALVLPDQESVW